MLLTMVSFLFVFLAITLVHEAGHLYFSKRAGIRVHEFGVGFGPTLFSIKKNNTIYKINSLPILGYVKIAGIDTEDPAEHETPENEKYYHKSLGSKFLAISSGAIMNFLLGFLIFSIIFMISGVPRGVSNEISLISPGSEAAKIGLLAGDKLVSIDGKTYDSPEKAINLIHQNANKELSLTILRGSKQLVYKATPKYHNRMKVGLIGFSLKTEYQRVGIIRSFFYGFTETLGLSLTIIVIVGKLILGKVALFDLAGPVGIAQITGQYAHHGILSLMSFLAFFSINVAVLNLLPLPALDGGRLCFLLLELVRRKPTNIEIENKIHAVGLFLFLCLFAVLTVNDLMRIFNR